MMRFSKEQAKKQFEANGKNISQQGLNDAVKHGHEKMKVMEEKSPGMLSKLWEDIKLMMALISDYSKGKYKDVPWRVISAVTAAIAYFVSPIDLISDFILGLGYLDDAFVIKLARDFAGDDLARYARWRAHTLTTN
jgi:uncharacterized membrane protein YkvA (DUF1232 family)